MIYFLYALAALWAIGCIHGALLFTVFMFDDEGPAVGVVCGCISIPLAVILALVPFAMISDSNDPHMSLNKTEWVCMNSRTIPVTTYVKSGNVMVPITSYQKVCDQYNRK